jgi:hypothetical protein
MVAGRDLTINYISPAWPQPVVRSVYLRQVERIAPAELLGRTRELDELAEFCTAPDGGPYLWLRAPAWAGKSALLSWFVMHPPPEVRVVSFFITARLASQDDRVAFADAVLEQALALLGQSIPPLLTESTRDGHVLAKLDEAAATCLEHGERLVLVVDGLDEDRGTDGHSVAALLPARPAAGMRIIVASRPNPPLPPDVGEDHPLRDRATVLRLSQSPYAAQTRTDTQREVKRLLFDQSGDGELLGLVAAAGGGLTARDLAELTSRQAWQVEDRLRATAGRTFVTRAGTWQDQETYVLGHEELQNEAVLLIGAGALDGYRQRLHDWADVYAGRGWPDGTPDYLLQGYFHLVRAAGPLARMVRLATDHARQARMLARSGAESAAAAELTMTQEAILAQEPPDLAAMATAAVHRDVMIRRNRNISADLPVLWARIGAYTRAEALAQSISDPEQRAAALQSIAAATLPEGSTGPEPADPPPVPVTSVARDSDNLTKHDVEVLIRAAQSPGIAYTAALLDAAEAIGRTATDPDLRARLRNDIASIRRTSTAVRDAPEEPDTELVVTIMLFSELDGVAMRTAARGDIGLAEQVAMSIPAGQDRDRALSRLLDAAIEAGSLADAERIARKLLTERTPTPLIRVARASLDHGDTERAERLLDYAHPEMRTQRTLWEQEAHVDAVKALAEIGDANAAMSLASGLAEVTTRLHTVLTVAQAAHRQGKDAYAKTLAAQVLQEAATAAPKWRSQSWHETLRDAASLLARLGGVVDARTAALALASPEDQVYVLAGIAEATLLDADLAAAEAASGLIEGQSGRDRLLPSFIRTYMRVGNHAAVMTAVNRVHGYTRARLITEAVRQALDEGVLDVDAARVYLDAAEVAIRSVPDPDWRAGALTEAAWALLPGADVGRIGMLTTAAEAAARQVLDAEARAAALVGIAAVVATVGDPARADLIFKDAARASPIPCAWAERLADRAWTAADRGHPDIAQAQVSAMSRLARWTAEPNNRERATQARLAAAIHIGDLSQAEDSARAIEHPDQQSLALIDVARALAAAGQAERGIAIALTITTEDRQADALSEVARVAAARGELDLAERAAGAITARGGRSPALLSVAWEAARARNLALAERIVASIADQEWQMLGLHAIHAQRDVSATARPRAKTANATIGPEQQDQDLLSRVDRSPDYPSTARLLAEAMRSGPCTSALGSLGEIDPPAVLAAADTLLALLK